MKTRSDVTVILDDYMGSEEKIVRAAQVSTKGKEIKLTKVTDPSRFVKWLYKEGHGSPFEHVVFSFYLEVPIFVSRQLVKHRISSINEASGRYHEFDPVGYVPAPERPLKQVGKTGEYRFEHLPAQHSNSVAHTILRSFYTVAEDTYNFLLNQGWAKEVARIVLPSGVYSAMFVTMNLRSWLNFVALRATNSPSHGQYEIAMVADQIMEQMREHVPHVIEAFEESGYVSV